jgi:prefoldin subunit 5
MAVAEPAIEYQAYALKAQAEQIEKYLEQIRRRIAELETAQSNAQAAPRQGDQDQ